MGTILEKTELSADRTAIFYQTKKWGIEMFVALIIDQNQVVIKELTGLDLIGIKNAVYNRHKQGKF